MIPRTPAAPGFFPPGRNAVGTGAAAVPNATGGGGGGAEAGYACGGAWGVGFVSLIVLTLPSGTVDAWRRFRGGRRRGPHGFDGAAEDLFEHELRVRRGARLPGGERTVDAVVETLRERRGVPPDRALLDAPDRGDARVRESPFAGGGEVGGGVARGGHRVHAQEREDEDRRRVGRRHGEPPVRQHGAQPRDDAAADVPARGRAEGLARDGPQAREERGGGLGPREGAGREEGEDLRRGLAAGGVLGLLREAREECLGREGTREKR